MSYPVDFVDVKTVWFAPSTGRVVVNGIPNWAALIHWIKANKHRRNGHLFAYPTVDQLVGRLVLLTLFRQATFFTPAESRASALGQSIIGNGSGWARTCANTDVTALFPAHRFKLMATKRRPTPGRTQHHLCHFRNQWAFFTLHFSLGSPGWKGGGGSPRKPVLGPWLVGGFDPLWLIPLLRRGRATQRCGTTNYTTWTSLKEQRASDRLSAYVEYQSGRLSTEETAATYQRKKKAERWTAAASTDSKLWCVPIGCFERFESVHLLRPPHSGKLSGENSFWGKGSWNGILWNFHFVEVLKYMSWYCKLINISDTLFQQICYDQNQSS